MSKVQRCELQQLTTWTENWLWAEVKGRSKWKNFQQANEYLGEEDGKKFTKTQSVYFMTGTVLSSLYQLTHLSPR